MILPPATPVIIRRLAHLAFLIFCVTIGTARTTQVTGTVTYVTAHSFYTDIGSSAGLAIGDTISVSHTDVMIGTGIVTNVSTNSSVCSIDGDVIMTKGDTASAFVSRQMEAPDSDIPVSEPTSAKYPTAANQVHGSLSVRSIRSTISDGETVDRSYANLNLSVDRLLSLPVSLNFYGRTGYKSESLDSGIRWHQLQLKYKYENWRIIAGRTYGTGIAGMGPVDGINASGKYGRWQIGVVAGADSRSDSGMKYGLFGRYSPNIRWLQSTHVAFQSVSGDSVDTQSLFLGARMRPWKILRISTDSKFNLNSSSSGIDFFNARMDMILRSWMRLNLAYSFTEQNDYYDPDPVIQDEQLQSLQRHQGTLSLFVSLPWDLGLMIQAGQIDMENQEAPLENYQCRLSRNDLIWDKLDVSVSGHMLRSVLYDQLGGGASLDYRFSRFDIQTVLMLETYKYGTGGENKQRLTYDLKLQARIAARFFGSVMLDFETSDDEDLFFSSIQLTYRL